MPDGSQKVLDGRDDNGRILCMAASANDAGPVLQNTLYAEFFEHPGRVFLEAKREIKEGEEIFVSYGSRYWGIEKYPDTFVSLDDWSKLPQLCNSKLSRN
eukprot:TRINITY_DN10339_c0_g1_i1.p2 TRINITY_DN10339_c0_g1~~TRINITY_DN10339_c0_g1_i1.p2  ORF type:complete len:111 (-),score=41.87 TRINITY_DN10339_c0_g1_i1:104-403(-)